MSATQNRGGAPWPRVWSLGSVAVAPPANTRAAAPPRYLVSRQLARKNSDWITSRTSASKALGDDLQF
jgi:hypothetical protein